MITRTSPARPPSIAAVAARAGVSIATVSRVVNGVTKKASAATEARVREAVAALDWRPSSAGRDLRHGRSRLVAILAANVANPAMAAIAAAISAALRQDGLATLLCDTADRADLQDEHLRETRALATRATVLIGAVQSPLLTTMRDAGETLLFVGRRCPDAPEAPFIGIDNFAAGAAVAAHFHAAGCRHMAVIHGPLSSSATAERVLGFRVRAQALGLALPHDAVLTAPGIDHLRIGQAAMRRLLARPGARPDGLFCLSDLIAYGAHRVASEAGLEVPRDLAMMGFDDNPLNDWVAPWLSSVEVPYARFGPAIVAALRQLLAGTAPEAPHTILPYRLVSRGVA